MAAVRRQLGLAQADRDTAQAWLAVLLDSTQDALIVADDAGCIVRCNAGAGRLLQCPPALLIGQTLATVLPGLPAAGGTVGLAIAAFPLELRTSDGALLQLEASVSSAQVDGRTYLTVIARDIGERLRTQAELVRRNIELQQFAYVASHDLRAPLRTLIGFLGIVLRKHGRELPVTSTDLLERSLRAAESLDQLTADLLAYARMDTEPRPMAPVDLGEVVEDCRLALSAEIAARGAMVEAAAGLPVVHGQRGQLVQLLQNLLANSLKYHRGTQPSQVRITARREGGHWEVCVRDNGPGVPADQRERVFEPFHRLHKQSEVPGTGLGLAICRRVVVNHGGTIRMDAAPDGGGAMVVFTLACEDPEA